MADCLSLAAQGRSILSEALRSKADGHPFEEKWPLGDLAIELTDAECDEVARLIGGAISGGKLRSYRVVAKAWPVDKRVDASWTTHRTLMNDPDRFDKIKAGMTLRQAQEAAGKARTDSMESKPFPMRRDFIVTQLRDKAMNGAVRDVLHERAAVRAARTVKMVSEDQQAEFKEKLRALRQTRDAKSPEVAANEAASDLRDIVEYVRAISKASIGDDAFLPAHSLTARVAALRDLGRTVVASLQLMSAQEPDARSALALLAAEVEASAPTHLDGSGSAQVIQGEAVWFDPGQVIDGDIA